MSVSDPSLDLQESNEKENVMETTWIVTQVTETPGMTSATLQQVEWFKKNPDFDVAMANESDDTLPEEFIDALPGDHGAETVEVGKPITVDITDGLDLHPLDNVVMTLRAVVLAEVD